MFACIHGRSVSKLPSENAAQALALVELAFTFSPLVEQTTADTVVLDISGQDLLFGNPTISSAAITEPAGVDTFTNVTQEIARRASELKLKISVAVARKPDVSIHAARSFKGTTIIENGDESARLSLLPIKNLDFSRAEIDEPRAAEIRETFALWGIGTFGELARLPLAGVAQRLGQEGVRLQKLAQG